jgi:hypothetical protein
MVSEQVTKAYNILRVIEIISESLVFKAAIRMNIKDFKIKITLDWDDELWNDWKNLGTTLVEHVENTLDGKESVWILLFSDTLEENGEIMMVVELLNFDFPVDSVLWTVFNGNWEITSVVESSELTGWDGSLIESSSLWLLWGWSFLWLIQTSGLTSETFSLFQDCYIIY